MITIQAGRPAADSAANAAGEQSHPLRWSLNAELHARPFMVVEAPARVLHIALLEPADGSPTGPELLAEFCRCLGVAPPVIDHAHLTLDLGTLRLKWEQHTEFTTFTLLLPGPFDHPFDNALLQAVPMSWWKRLQGRVLAAVQVAIGKGAPPDALPGGPPGGGSGGVPGAPDEAAGPRYFTGIPVAGSRVLGGGARIWSDFRIGPDGFSRFLLWDTALREQQAGRLIQRILEIETYSMMALLALPMARRSVAEVAAAEARTGELTQRMLDNPHGEVEHGLLEDLTQLAAGVEGMIAGSSYRFNATLAYYAIVEARIAELREDRIEGTPTFGEFMERRLAPAMQFCRSIARQQADLSQRIMRATQLLRTRVDVALERQNRDLLRSMDKRTQMQLRLQETVEGLSVIAISYYLASLLGHFAEWVSGSLFGLDLHHVTGALVLPVLALVWFGARRMRRMLHGAMAAE